MRNVCLLIFVLCLSSCASTRGGSGQTTDGDPVVLEIRRDNDLSESFVISSVRGWSCIGVLTDEQVNETLRSVIRVPLKCNNGETGTSLISLDRFAGSADFNFRLSDGTTGNAKIG